MVAGARTVREKDMAERTKMRSAEDELRAQKRQAVELLMESQNAPPLSWRKKGKIELLKIARQ